MNFKNYWMGVKMNKTVTTFLTVSILIWFLIYVHYVHQQAYGYEYDFFEAPYDVDYVDNEWVQKWTYCWNCPAPIILIIDDDDKTKIIPQVPPGPPCETPPCGQGPPDDTPGNGNGPPDGPPGLPDDTPGNGNGPPDNPGNGGGNGKGKGKKK